VAAQHIHLGLHGRNGKRGRGVGGVVQIAAPTREIAARHHADGRTAAFFVAPEHLVGGTELRIDPRPGGIKGSPRGGRHRRAQALPKVAQPHRSLVRGSRAETRHGAVVLACCLTLWRAVLGRRLAIRQ